MEKFKNFFKNNKGKVVIWQSPNMPLIGWFAAKVLSLIIDNQQVKNGLSMLSTAFIFTWAYLEITKGASYFRRLAGSVVLALTLIGFFS